MTANVARKIEAVAPQVGRYHSYNFFDYALDAEASTVFEGYAESIC